MARMEWPWLGRSLRTPAKRVVPQQTPFEEKLVTLKNLVMYVVNDMAWNYETLIERPCHGSRLSKGYVEMGEPAINQSLPKAAPPLGPYDQWTADQKANFMTMILSQHSQLHQPFLQMEMLPLEQRLQMQQQQRQLHEQYLQQMYQQQQLQQQRLMQQTMLATQAQTHVDTQPQAAMAANQQTPDGSQHAAAHPIPAAEQDNWEPRQPDHPPPGWKTWEGEDDHDGQWWDKWDDDDESQHTWKKRRYDDGYYDDSYGYGDKNDEEGNWGDSHMDQGSGSSWGDWYEQPSHYGQWNWESSHATGAVQKVDQGDDTLPEKFSVILTQDTCAFECPFFSDMQWLRVRKPPPALTPVVVPARVINTSSVRGLSSQDRDEKGDDERYESVKETG